MKEEDNTSNCRHCKIQLQGRYCSDCGQPRELTRINGNYIWSEIRSVFNFEKGILFTVKELLLRPGPNVQNFIQVDRKRLVKPVVFILICSLVYTICLQYFEFEDGYVNYSFEDDSTITTLFQWFSNNYGYTNILISGFIAFWIKIFFNKSGYNFYEILILLCFVLGMGMLIFTVFGTFESLTSLKTTDKGFLVGIVYMTWAIGQFFQGGRIKNFFKALACYFLGILSFAIGVILMGLIIGYFK